MVKRTKSISTVSIPDGIYKGKWNGNIVNVWIPNGGSWVVSNDVEVDNSIVGKDVKCDVVIKEKQLYVD